MPDAKTVLSWLLAPLLGVSAIILQCQIDVPKGDMIPRAKSKSKSKSKSSAARKPPERKPWKARDPAQVEKLRATWDSRPLKDEPVDPAFRRRHDSVLRAVTRLVRREVIAGGEAVAIEIHPSCHTIRCELQICGPEEVVLAMAELLPEVHLRHGKLWRDIDAVEHSRGPPEGSSSPTRCRRWVVSFASDSVNKSTLRLDTGLGKTP